MRPVRPRPGRRYRRGTNRQLTLAPTRGSGCNRVKHHPGQHRCGTCSRENRPCTGLSISTRTIPPQQAARERAQFDAARRFRSRQSRAVHDTDYVLAVFRPAAPGRSRSTTARTAMFGPYWSVTKYNDIMEIETNHAVFSSAAALGGITIRDIGAESAPRELHRHGPAARTAPQRKTVAPMFTPTHLDRARDQHPQALGRGAWTTCRCNETFDWVDKRLDRADHADAGRAVRLSRGRTAAS